MGVLIGVLIAVARGVVAAVVDCVALPANLEAILLVAAFLADESLGLAIT